MCRHRNAPNWRRKNERGASQRAQDRRGEVSVGNGSSLARAGRFCAALGAGDRVAGIGSERVWSFCRAPAVFLFLSVRLPLLAATFSWLLSLDDDAPTHERTLGLSDAAFFRSRLHGAAVDVNIIHPHFFWTALSLSLGEAGGIGCGKSFAPAARLFQQRRIHSASGFLPRALDDDGLAIAPIVIGTGLNDRCR